MPWNEFVNNVYSVDFLFKDEETKQAFKNKLPVNLDDFLQKYKEYEYKEEESIKAKRKEAEDGKITWDEYYDYTFQYRPFEYE